jgi:hypothetical protein
MERLFIEKEIDSPEVLFDKIENTFFIKGRSLPENAVKFYSPLFDWLQIYSKNPNKKTIMEFRFEYFNTTSSKRVLDMLSIFEEMKEAGHEVEIHWYYEHYDKDMKDAGREYSDMLDLPFKLIEYKLD